MPTLDRGAVDDLAQTLLTDIDLAEASTHEGLAALAQVALQLAEQAGAPREEVLDWFASLLD